MGRHRRAREVAEEGEGPQRGLRVRSGGGILRKSRLDSGEGVMLFYDVANLFCTGFHL